MPGFARRQVRGQTGKSTICMPNTLARNSVDSLIADYAGPIVRVTGGFVAPAPHPSIQQRWDNANKAYYQTVDWALDLREAEFQGSIDLHCMPGSLIRRDPETQVLIKRSSLKDVDWRSLFWGKSSFDLAIQWFLEDGLYDDVVLIAPKRAAYLKDDLQAIAMLRSEGIAAYD